jgi:hypothetical protein
MKLLEVSKELNVSREIIMKIVKENFIPLDIKYNNKSQKYYDFDNHTIEKIKIILNTKPNKTRFKKFS